MYLLANNMPEMMFGLGLVMLIFILLKRTIRGTTARVPKQPPTTSATPRSDIPLLDAPAEMVRWQVEMHDCARDMKAELDTKMGALQVLIHIANEEISRLESVIERAESCDRHGGLATEERSSNHLPGDKNQRQLVYAMADIGEPSETIAVAAGTSVGDVEMMLSCRGAGD